MSSTKKSDTLFLAIVFLSLCMALFMDSTPAAIIFATLIADDAFDRWMKRSDNR